MTLGAGALNALLVFFVTENLHTAADWYGTIGMGEGLGAIAGTLIAGVDLQSPGRRAGVLLRPVVAGIGILGFARLDNLWQAVVTLAVLGIPMGALNVALTPIILRAVPRELLGRVAGIMTPVQYLASMIAALGAGWLASTALRDFHLDIGPVTLGRSTPSSRSPSSSSLSAAPTPRSRYAVRGRPRRSPARGRRSPRSLSPSSSRRPRAAGGRRRATGHDPPAAGHDPPGRRPIMELTARTAAIMTSTS